MGVSDQERAENGVHDRVEGAGSERSDGEGNQTDTHGAGTKLACQFPVFKVSALLHSGCDEPLEGPVVATLGGVRLGNGNGIVHYRGS